MNETEIVLPTNPSDSSHRKETVEVGVVIMGVCCICLVACALVILQIRANNRRIAGRRRRSELAENRSADRARDPLDVEAPPSYDAVIRSPHLYPPSRRTSLDTRRSSGSSTFSFSIHSPRLTPHPRVAPGGSPGDGLSQPLENHAQGSSVEDSEEPPPPYPGNTEPSASPSIVSMENVTHRNERSTRPCDHNKNCRYSDRRVHRAPAGQGQSFGPGASHVQHAWTESETGQLRPSHSNNSVSRDRSTLEGENSVVGKSERSPSRTDVIQALRHYKGVESTPVSQSENSQRTEAV